MSYDASDLHGVAASLERETSPARRELGRHLRQVAHALCAIDKRDRGHITQDEEARAIYLALPLVVVEAQR